MIKGCQRRIIIVNDTGSPYFDSAYFVLKSDLPRSCANVDMMAEAHKLISGAGKTSSIKQSSEKRSSGRVLFWILAGTAVIAAAIAFGIVLL